MPNQDAPTLSSSNLRGTTATSEGRPAFKGSSEIHSTTKVTGKYDLDVSDTIHIKAPTSITLECPDSKIEMLPGKIVITLDANVLAVAKGEALLKLDANVTSMAKGGAALAMNEDVLLSAKGGGNLRSVDRILAWRRSSIDAWSYGKGAMFAHTTQDVERLDVSYERKLSDYSLLRIHEGL